MKSAVTKVCHSGIQTNSFAKVVPEPVTRFPVRPKRAVSKTVITQLNSRLHTAQMVAGQEVHQAVQKKDASIRAKHVRRRTIRRSVMWQPTVTLTIVESQARAE